MFNLLEDNLKKAPIFEDPLTHSTYYKFGEPINNPLIFSFGAKERLPIKNLYLGLRIAEKYLNHQQKNIYLKKLHHLEKHDEILFEMRPLIDLKNGFNFVEYESKKNCIGEKDVDWFLHNDDWTISFEVKHRIFPSIDHIKDLKNIIDSLNSGIKSSEIGSVNTPDPERLFLNTFQKFRDRPNDKTLQGAWLLSGILLDKQLLENYFKSIDPKKMQFAIISDWENKAFILVKNELYRPVIKDYFGLIDSSQFVSSYPQY